MLEEIEMASNLAMSQDFYELMNKIDEFFSRPRNLLPKCYLYSSVFGK
jgi:hypothetical protein